MEVNLPGGGGNLAEAPSLQSLSPALGEQRHAGCVTWGPHAMGGWGGKRILSSLLLSGLARKQGGGCGLVRCGVVPFRLEFASPGSVGKKKGE